MNWLYASMACINVQRRASALRLSQPFTKWKRRSNGEKLCAVSFVSNLDVLPCRNAYKEADKLSEDQAKDEYVKELQKVC